MNTLYLAIQHTYTQVQLGLYSNNNRLGYIEIHKHDASSLLHEKIKELLTQHNTNLAELDFFAVNQGPGPFTTLRVVIATINGICFALGKQIVGVDGIQACVNEYTHQDQEITVALLNAFNEDVYFAIKHAHNPIVTGAQNCTELLKSLHKEFGSQSSITFIGNGATMHAQTILEHIPRAQIKQEIQHSSLGAIAQQGLAQWHKKEQITRQLQPLYIKNTVYNNLRIA